MKTKLFIIVILCMANLNLYAATKKVEVKVGEYTFEYRISEDKTASLLGLADGCEAGTADLILTDTIVVDGENILVDDVDAFAFQYKTGFTGRLIIEPGIKRFGEMSFQGCTNLRGTLDFANDVTYIGYSAFEDCESLTGDLKIPDATTWQNNRFTFKNCKGLNGKLTLGKNMKWIGEEDFHGCTGLIGDLIIPNKVTKIGKAAFAECNNLDGIMQLPEGLKIIGLSAFQNCRSLTGDIVLPHSVDSLEGATFIMVEYIDGKPIKGSFRGDIVIGDGIKRIPYNCFVYCGSRGKLTIGKSVTEISAAFMTVAVDTVSFTEIYVRNSTPPRLSINAFNPAPQYYFPSKTPLYVPEGSLEAYKKADVWSKFKDIRTYEPIFSDLDINEDKIEMPFTQCGNTLNFKQVEKVELFDIDGRLILTKNLSQVELPKAGKYIIKVNGQGFKVLAF